MIIVGNRSLRLLSDDWRLAFLLPILELPGLEPSHFLEGLYFFLPFGNSVRVRINGQVESHSHLPCFSGFPLLFGLLSEIALAPLQGQDQIILPLPTAPHRKVAHQLLDIRFAGTFLRVADIERGRAKFRPSRPEGLVVSTFVPEFI